MTRQPDAQFADPQLVRLYDPLDPDRRDLEPYLALIDEFDAHVVVDVGCGTGSFACLAAQRSGVTVFGLDPATASIDVARAKQSAEAVEWFVGDAPAFAARHPQVAADLVVMTGNVAQVFVDDTDWMATLSAVRALLRTGGHFVFETRDPAARAWERWTPEASRSAATVAGVGRVTSHVEVTDAALPLVSFTTTFTIGDDGSEQTSTSTLRFRERAEIEAQLAAAGLVVEDVRDAADRPGLEWVFVARAD